jgi:hypothetical protein
MQTLFRGVLMLATLAVVWKGWQLYGPSAKDLRSLASRAVEMAEKALDGQSNSDGSTLNPDDPRLTAPPFATPSLAPADTTHRASTSGPAALESNSPPLLPAESEVISTAALAIEPASAETGISTMETTSAPSGAVPGGRGQLDRLEAMLAGLEALGVSDHQLESWGTGRQLYRFSCRAAWGESTSFSRHFESVAPEPLAAVAAVAEQVSAWRVAENGGSRWR